MRPPAAVSATEMVSLRSRSRLATLEAASLRAGGGKSDMAVLDVMWKTGGHREELIAQVKLKASGLLITGTISNHICMVCCLYPPPLGSIGNLGDDGFFLSGYRHICLRPGLSACRSITQPVCPSTSMSAWN